MTNSQIIYFLAITRFLHQRFVKSMDAPSVKRVSVRNNHFILINSMALEGDNCFLCKPTEIAVKNIQSKQNYQFIKTS